MKQKSGNMPNEADIGSGEKSPGQKETEEMIRQVKPQGEQAGSAPPAPQKDQSPPQDPARR